LWKRHIKKHGYDVTTKVLFQTENVDLLKEKGLYYSNLWNIVESNEFANLAPECGDGGPRAWSEESRQKLSEATKGKRKPNTINYKLAQSRLRNEKSQQQKKFLSDPANYAKRCKQLRQSTDYKKLSKIISSLKWCNDGKRNYRLKDIPEGYVAGVLKLSS
jgi:hypothetical protein